jgi:glycosyltransferase involved in cell wall biosynthesis
MIAVTPQITTIHQILPQLSPRDAIGAEALLIQGLLRQNGIEGEIFYDERGERDFARPLDHLKNIQLKNRATACLYHFSVGSPIPFRLMDLGYRIWSRYHNITPGYFFNKPLEKPAQMACNLGRRQIPIVGLLSEVILSDSFYNLKEIAPHTSAKTAVIPVFRDYDHLLGRSKVAPKFIKADGRKTLLFVGRICPNKAQHDIIELLALDKQFGIKNMRLVLVGGFYSHDFKDAIVGYARALNLTVSIGEQINWSADVIIPGSISDEDMAACYRDADVFVSLSDHEGFGVPLVEAMSFGLPILAHKSSAVTETVGDAGVLVDKSDKISLLRELDRIIKDDQLRAELNKKAAIRAKELGLDAASSKLLSFIRQFSSHQTS